MFSLTLYRVGKTDNPHPSEGSYAPSRCPSQNRVK